MHVNSYDLQRMTPEEREALYRRPGVDLSELIGQVLPLVEAVRTRGDSAVCEFAKRFDKADMSPADFRVPEAEMSQAVRGLAPDLREAIKVSIDNIRKFHERQIEPPSWEITISPGIVAGEKVLPIASVGLYVPRGKGSFPSMMMMAGVPAKVAGVERIVVVTPPDPQGKADKATLAAAHLIGIDEVYAVGGVQAVAALAYGTETIPRVDKIVGPGSGYVLAAKQILSSLVDTGLAAGPSEAIVLADDSVDPVIAITDLLIEAEHGPDSSAYLVTTSKELAEKAPHLIAELVSRLPEERKGYCEKVFQASGGVVLAPTMDEACDFINGFAPEHLQILTSEPEKLLEKIQYAGEVLLGTFTPGTLANYSLGPNAILPTSGFARTASALSVRDFTRRMSFSRAEEEGFKSLAPKTLVLAEYEGFAAHAAALKHRLKLPQRGSSMADFTHFDDRGQAIMVDVGDKDVTAREAVARGEVAMQPETLALILEGRAKKGDVLGIARIAGIMGAKRTPDLIPLAHPLPITSVRIEFFPDAERSVIEIQATVKVTGKTGVEMEALTAVTCAGLTVYDMCKAVDRGMTISKIRLMEKSGGRSGHFVRDVDAQRNYLPITWRLLMDPKTSDPADMTKDELIRVAGMFFEDVLVHYGLWFSEAVRQSGIEQALSLESRVMERYFPLAAARIAPHLGLEMDGNIPRVLANKSREELLLLVADIAKTWLTSDGLWFQALESTAGMAAAKEANDTCWSHFAFMEAFKIKKYLGLGDSGGLKALETALNLRVYSTINAHSASWDSDGTLLFSMTECRVQAARRRKGLEEYACKSAGIVEYSNFARGIDPRIRTDCVWCPPDRVPDEAFCTWRFSLEPQRYGRIQGDKAYSREPW